LKYVKIKIKTNEKITIKKKLKELVSNGDVIRIIREYLNKLNNYKTI